MIKQKTIKNIVELNGIGLHSGKTVNMKIMPAGADSGIRFRRTDVTPVVDIQLREFEFQQSSISFLRCLAWGLITSWWSSMLQNFPFSMGVPEDS